MKRLLLAVAALLALVSSASAQTIVQCKTSGGAQGACANASIQTAKLVDGATFVTLTGSQILTNKTLDCTNNTCTVRLGSDVTGVLGKANGGFGVNVNTGLTAFASPYVDSAGAMQIGTPSASNLASRAAAIFYFASPAAVGTAVATALAANAAGNSFTITTSTFDVCRTARVVFAAGWDGGNVTLNGTNCLGTAASDTITASAGSTVGGVVAFATLTSASKGSVGASAATATIQYDGRLGFATKRTIDVNAGFLIVDRSSIEAPFLSSSGSCNLNCANMYPTTAPNGSHKYIWVQMSP